MGVQPSVLTGSLQGIAERPLPCNYNVIQLISFTAVTRVQNPVGDANSVSYGRIVYSLFNKMIRNYWQLS
jgi:hypothetical protein